MSRFKKSRMTYSRGADAFALSFHPRPAGRPLTSEIAPGIKADYIGEQLVGFEILDASTLIPLAALMTIEQPGETLTPEEAGRLKGRDPRTIRYAAAHGKIPGAVREGRDWIIPTTGLDFYIEHLPARGRPPKKRTAPNRRRSATKK